MSGTEKERRQRLIEADVREFLLTVKLRVAEDRWTFVNRDKNLDALAELNMFPTDVATVLRDLKVRDYCEGPLEDDRKRPILWWVFGPTCMDESLYVKIGDHPAGQLLCMSFHRNEFPLHYPLREGEGE